jgi:hypothetical protein
MKVGRILETFIRVKPFFFSFINVRSNRVQGFCTFGHWRAFFIE